MASTYSPNLRLELIATGEKQGTWGTVTNTNLGTLLEEAIGGYVSVTVSDVADTTLTTNDGSADQSRNMVINLTGALTNTRNVICPAIEKLYVVKNATTGGQSVVFKVSGQTGVTIPNGTIEFLYVDGTDARTITGSIASQDSNNVSITGGSLSGVTIANTSVSNSSIVANASSLSVRDSDGSNILSIAVGSNLTANTVLTLTTGATSNRTLDISASNVTISTAGANLIDDADASAQRTTLGLGTIATQNSNNVTITGGSITGITDLALADGGTGASLTDPNANAVLGWNDTAGVMRFFTAGAGISINATSNTIISTATSNVAITTYTSGSGNWTVPSSGTVALVRAWGGGGSGGRAASSGGGGAGGGGGGGYTEELYQLSALGSAGASIAYSVGAGGNAISSSAGNGNPGGNTTFSSGATLLTAYGGGGGTSAQLPATGGGGGGALGAGAPNTAGRLGGGASAGDPTTVWGGAGGGRSDANNPATAYLGGGGGGGATNSIARAAGDSLQGGAGGAGVFNGTTGNAGTAPGGGGGAQGANAGSSGAGAAGRIEIWVW
jgi:hypothetical protein